MMLAMAGLDQVAPARMPKKTSTRVYVEITTD